MAGAEPRPVGDSLRRGEGGDGATHQWSPAGGPDFTVRCGPDYARNGLKQPSVAALYECVAVDFFRSPVKLADVAAKRPLPWDAGERPGRRAESELEAKETGVPPFFVVCCNIPDYGPPNPVWGKAKDDGDGYCLILYLRILPAAVEALREGGRSGANLVRAFINAQDGSELRQRFKGIARVDNLPEVELNGLVKKLVSSYNATPFLIRTTSTFHRGDGYFEVDVDVHRFSYLALQGLNGLKARINEAVADLGFTIQAEDDEEMPEVILGCARLHRLQLREAADSVLHE